MGEIDIWRSAALLLREHGDGAEREAERHMRAVIARTDAEGEAVWRRVLEAIATLRNTQPDAPTN